MTIKDHSLARRLQKLEDELEATRRELDAARTQRATAWQWPRAQFLGRTWSTSASNYPTSGDTFQVKLLEGDFSPSEGTQAVNEIERGTTIVARTWPATYLARNTEVVVDHIPGLGAHTQGQYWIRPAGAGGDPHVMYGGTAYYLNGGNARTTTLQGGALYRLKAFPVLGSGEDSGAYVTSVPNPLTFGQASLTFVTAGWYHVLINTEWALWDLTPAQADYWYLSYYTAPNTQTYPVWTRYGPGSFSLTTSIVPTGHTTAGGNLRSSSTGICRTLSSYVPAFKRFNHLLLAVLEMPAGATIDIYQEASMDMPTHVSQGIQAYWPRAEIQSTEVELIYCGA